MNRRTTRTIQAVIGLAILALAAACIVALLGLLTPTEFVKTALAIIIATIGGVIGGVLLTSDPDRK